MSNVGNAALGGESTFKKNEAPHLSVNEAQSRKHHYSAGCQSEEQLVAMAGDPCAGQKQHSLAAILADIPGNGCLQQEARILAALASWSITTFEASRYLDIYDPRARVMALRRKGHEILTTWVNVPTESGKCHRVGLYALVRGFK